MLKNACRRQRRKAFICYISVKWRVNIYALFITKIAYYYDSEMAFCRFLIARGDFGRHEMFLKIKFKKVDILT